MLKNFNNVRIREKILNYPNKKGFTLVELLGVIIVLAIISLIAVPITLKIIDMSRKNSFKVSAEGVIRAATMYYSDNTDRVYTHFKKSGTNYITFEFDEAVGKKGINELGDTLDLSGKIPVGGKVIVYKTGDVEVVDLTDGIYYVNKEVDDSIKISDDTAGPSREELNEMIEKLQKEIDKINSKNDDQDERIDKNAQDIDELEENVNKISGDVLDKTYPIGSIYISTNGTSPTTIFGGVWERYGEGKTLVSLDSSNSNFDTVNKTGGKDNVTLSTDNLPSHTHTIPKLTGSSNSAGGHTHTYSGSTNSTGSHTHNASGNTNTTGNHSHTVNIWTSGWGGWPSMTSPFGHYVLLWSQSVQANYRQEQITGNMMAATYGNTDTIGNHSHSFNVNTSSAGSHSHSFSGTTANSGSHTHTISTDESKTSSTGSTKAFSVQNPYITVYMWKRVA